MRTLIRSIVVGLVATLLASVASANEVITYEYDAQGRLVKVVHTGTVNNGEQVIYTTDKADNRTKKVTTGA